MYDPLIDKCVPNQFHTPNGYWAKNASPIIYPGLQANIDVEVAIIGGGFTGLSTAYYLKKLYNVDCVVLEANQPGWGCSGRNGGFVLPGTGRLSSAKMVSKFGSEVASAMFDEFAISISHVKQLIENDIECDQTTGGFLKLSQACS